MTVISRNFIIKVASRCNLNCSYCYMFNMGDNTYLEKPKVMETEVAVNMLNKIFDYAKRKNITNLGIHIHGGEPLLVGKKWMEWFVNTAYELKPSRVKINFHIQSNGTLLDRDWTGIFSSNNVTVGISFDGPAEIHDLYRLDHSGEGSYSKAREAIELLSSLGRKAPPWGVLVVANPEYSGIDIFKHLLELGVTSMDFLWPDYHHENPPPWPQGVIGKYYKDLFDYWYDSKDPTIYIRWFVEAIRVSLNQSSRTDGLGLGPGPESAIVIETDGSIEPADSLRICSNGITRLGLNVLNNHIDDIYNYEIFQEGINIHKNMVQQCSQCSIFELCGGGALQHKWDHINRFKNPSVYCSDLFNVLDHIRRRVYEDLKKVM